jgi:pimeloyl-ACP methyl ester carboxylesterase
VNNGSSSRFVLSHARLIEEIAVTVQTRFLLVDGVRTHYLDAGEGPSILLLHSGEFGACAELSWEFTIGKLAERYRVIAPDWLGYGQTDKLYDFGGGQARLISHMRRFMEVMELEDSHVIGNSMGGSIFARAVALEPQAYRVRSLTLISSGGFNPDNEHRRAMMDYDCSTESMKAMLRAMFVDPKWSEDPAYVQRRVELSIRPGAWETIAAARFKNPITPPRQFFGRPDDTPYQNLAMPTLIIAGDEDKLRLRGWAKEVADQIPGSELHVISGTGHCPHLERPDEVNAVILGFLDRLDD